MRRQPVCTRRTVEYPTLLDHPGARKLLLGACVAAAVVGCGDDGKIDGIPGDTGRIPDETGDSASGDTGDTEPVDTGQIAGDTYGYPHLITFGVMFGVQDGQVVDGAADGEVIPPTLQFTLAEEAYLDTWDERYACHVYYDLAPTPGGTAPEAWYDLDLGATLRDSSCPDHGNWRPETWGWATDAVELALMEPDAEISAVIAKHYDAEYATSLFGGQVWFDGALLSGPSDQTLIGWAYGVDEAMEIGDELLDNAEVAAGTDAWINVQSVYFWYSG